MELRKGLLQAYPYISFFTAFYAGFNKLHAAVTVQNGGVRKTLSRIMVFLRQQILTEVPINVAKGLQKSLIVGRGDTAEGSAVC